MLCKMYKQKNEKNVRPAGQTIGYSIANSIEYLLKIDHPDFVGSEVSIEFLSFFS